MRKRGEHLMKSVFEAVGPILLGALGLALLIFILYKLVLSIQTGPSQTKKMVQKNDERENIRLTSKDRDLLELIGDLAELYRATGR